MSNTIASNNRVGIAVQPTGGAVVAGVLSKVTANNNGAAGIFVLGQPTGASLNVTIVDSAASNNTGASGVSAGTPGPGAATSVMLRNVVASNNSITGLDAGGAFLRVAHSVVTGNAVGVSAGFGGTIQSYGDNDIDGNTNNNTGALTPLAMH